VPALFPDQAAIPDNVDIPKADSSPQTLTPPLAVPAHPSWYVAYTCANHEKRVAEQFERRRIEHLLPLYKALRQWRDRRVYLQYPLFPGYIFVRLALRDKLWVLQTAGVVRLVGVGGNPIPINDEEIVVLRRALVDTKRVEPHPYLTVGRRVRVTAGPLVGYEGIMVRRKSRLRVVLSIAAIERSIVVDMDAASVQPIVSASLGHRQRVI